MAEGGFYQQKRVSPTSLAVVVALHAAAIAALALSKMDIIVAKSKPTEVFLVDQPKVPPPNPEPVEKKVEPRQKSVIDQVPAVIPVDRPSDMALERQPDIIPAVDPVPTGESLTPPIDPPQPAREPEPVRVDARIDPRSELQPPYPPSEQRAEREGSVTVRVLIGADGRVKQVEKVRAASDAFFRATEQQALRHWRFAPATVDGKPVESRKTLTVHFRLQA